VIDPRKSRCMPYWDCLTALALLYTAVFTPVEVALFKTPTSPDGLFWFNRVIDLIFLVDIVIQFLLAYESDHQAGAWEVRLPVIARGYLSTWFVLDSASVLVSLVDVLDVTVDLRSTSGSFSPAKLKILRIFRVLRLLKLARLYRGSAVFARLEMRMTIDYGLLAIGTSLGQTLAAAHWAACIWALQAAWAQDVGETWIGALGLACRKSIDGHVQGCPNVDVRTPTQCERDGYYGMINGSDSTGVSLEMIDLVADLEGADAWPHCLPVGKVYLSALYFAVYTITSIGYGDITANKDNEVEVAVATTMMLGGAILWGTVVATFVGEIAAFNLEGVAFRKTMSDLNRMMKTNSLPKQMCMQLREYVHRSKYLREASAEAELMRNLSPSLQGEVTWSLNAKWLRKITFLHGAPRALMVRTAMALSPLLFPPGDSAPAGYLYIINRGVALYRAKLLGRGRVWGEDFILSSERLRSLYVAKAMNYLEVFYLARDPLLAIASDFPIIGRRIRRLAVFMALRRDLILTVSMYKAAEKAKAMAKATLKSPGVKAVATSEVVGGAEAGSGSGASKGAASLPVALPQSMPPDSKWGEERTVLSRLVEYKERRDVYFGPSAQEVLMREKMQRRQTSDVTTAELMAAVVVVERGQTEQAEALARLGCQVADVLQLLHGPRDRNGKERIDGDGGAGEGGRDGDGAFTA